MNPILIVEDDVDISNLLCHILRGAGYEVMQAFSGTEAVMRVQREAPALILLDLMLPGIDGEAFLKKLRGELCLGMPVIVLSAKNALRDKVALLSMGADDYVTKPFEPEEVVARVQAALRRHGQGAAQVRQEMRHRNLVLWPQERRAAVCGQALTLTAREFDILLLLMRHPQKVFSKENLYEQVWKDGYYGENHTVSVHVSNLRKKIKALDPDEEYIQTVYGIGFRL